MAESMATVTMRVSLRLIDRVPASPMSMVASLNAAFQRKSLSGGR